MNLKEIKPDYPDISLQDITQADQVFGMFKTVAAVPTGIPKNWYDQIQIYVSGVTFRLYYYDSTNKIWRYAQGI